MTTVPNDWIIQSGFIIVLTESTLILYSNVYSFKVLVFVDWQQNKSIGLLMFGMSLLKETFPNSDSQSVRFRTLSLN
jgi:hypothetical protein